MKRIAVAWLREEDWPRWLEIDPRMLPTYAAWRLRMERLLADLERRGLCLVKVVIDPDEFVAWAAGDVGSTQRARFATLKAAGAETGLRH